MPVKPPIKDPGVYTPEADPRESIKTSLARIELGKACTEYYNALYGGLRDGQSESPIDTFLDRWIETAHIYVESSLNDAVQRHVGENLTQETLQVIQTEIQDIITRLRHSPDRAIRGLVARRVRTKVFVDPENPSKVKVLVSKASYSDPEL